ncbi:hypothetical protein PAXINDRAFT_181135 [Paxillus involutus ATCC 200175]|uniref:Uncharacterized protein n=1 Tax=Paxillus involutus ATCC 200175 TaxID=664439 RepID=A0A0C9U411_PAXIN|nr:hypothetical protein PAXINDRAFT_181135 [Paxillus involutus ATCC 200175]
MPELEVHPSARLPYPRLHQNAYVPDPREEDGIRSSAVKIARFTDTSLLPERHPHQAWMKEPVSTAAEELRVLARLGKAAVGDHIATEQTGAVEARVGGSCHRSIDTGEHDEFRSPGREGLTAGSKDRDNESKELP